MLVLHCFSVGYAISNVYLKLGLILGRFHVSGFLFCFCTLDSGLLWILEVCLVASTLLGIRTKRKIVTVLDCCD